LTMHNMRRGPIQMFFSKHLKRSKGQMVWQMTYRL
jgi:hypothetical protein